MDFWFWLLLIVIAVGGWIAFNYLKRLWQEFRDYSRRLWREFRDYFRRLWRDLRAWCFAHRKALIISPLVVSVATPLTYFTWVSLFRAAPTALQTTVPWSAVKSAVRVSTGIALTTAAARGQAEGIVWQNWVVPVDRKEPAAQLQPNRSYVFNLALTPGAVQRAGDKVTIASAEAQEAVRNTLRTQKQAVLTTVFLADSERLSLQPGETVEKQLVIDVPRLLGDQKKRDRPAPSLDSIIESAFARVTYKVQTGASAGWTKASVLLLANNRPIDQIVTTQCVGECAGPMPSGRVSGSPRLYALLQAAPAADISLFLTELEPGKLHGVLVSRAQVNGRSMWRWETKRGAPGFANIIRKTIRQLYDKKLYSRAELLEKGSALSDLLFSDSVEGRQALEAFRQLATESSKWQLGDGAAPKSLFVHFDFAEADEGPMIVPIGLMTYDAQGGPDFVGRHFMIEQPMMLPNYVRPAECVGNWVLLLPDVAAAAADDPLKLARSAIVTLKTTWPGSDRLMQFSEIKEFERWLRTKSSPRPTVVTTLSHHDANLMYFRKGGPSIASLNVLREFGRPSIAILNGCDTGQSGTMDFVVQFNQRGVDSAVVSPFALHGAIAGSYLACLRRALSDRAKSIAHAHFQAVNMCTWSEAQAPDATTDTSPDKLLKETYAANALKYVLIGNGATTICP